MTTHPNLMYHEGDGDRSLEGRERRQRGRLEKRKGDLEDHGTSVDNNS